MILLLMIASITTSTIGCRDAVPIEDRSIAVALAIDQTGNQVTFTTLVLNNAKGRTTPTVTIAGMGQTAGQTREQRQRESPTRIMFGQLQAIILSEEFARRGVSIEIDPVIRIPQIANTISIAVCQGSAHQLLLGDHDQQSDMGGYLRELLLKAPATVPLPRASLHEFIYDLTTTHRRAMVPYLVLNDQGRPELEGVAVFVGDQMRSVFTGDDAALLTLLRDQGVSGIFTFPYPTKNGVGIASFQGTGQRRVRATKSGDGEWSFRVEISLKGTIVDKVHGDGLRSDRKTFDMLVEKLKAHMEARAATLVKMLQEEIRIDALNLAKYAQQTDRANLAKADWDALFTRAQVQVVFKPTITDFGEGQ